MSGAVGARPDGDRIQSIDTFRALTMLLMIWVNDFWRVSGVPHWLEHMPADVDALGFSDVIFPAFLFIVGLSIPFAIRQRRERGDEAGTILRHIVGRSVALLVMGVFMVNLEYAEPGSLGIDRTWWQILMILGFGLIWNAYPKGGEAAARWSRVLRLAGVGGLVALVVLYQHGPWWQFGGMQPHWWGILGLIGWAYLIGSVLCWWLGQNSWWVGLGWAGLVLFNIGAFTGWWAVLEPLQPYVWVVGDGSIPALTMAGVLVSTVYQQFCTAGNRAGFLRFLLVGGGLTLLLGLGLRPWGGISKIHGTPAWTLICTGISLFAYAGLYWLIDVRGITRWARFLKVAGTATLTCYLVPYLAYPVMGWIGWSLPESVMSGGLGLAVAMIFSLAVIGLTALLGRAGIRLKL